MKKKAAKIEEARTPYAEKKPAKAAPASARPGIRYADLDKVRQTNAKLIQVHRVVLEKLAR